jgi:hypothetical protein
MKKNFIFWFFYFNFLWILKSKVKILILWIEIMSGIKIKNLWLKKKRKKINIFNKILIILNKEK